MTDVAVRQGSIQKAFSRDVVIALDISGSMHPTVVRRFFEVIDASMREGAHVTILLWDTMTTVLSNHYKKGDWNRMLSTYSGVIGGGGTDPQVVFDWMVNNERQSSSLMILTDGYFGDEKYNTKGIHTLWVVTEEDQYPRGGAVLHINAEGVWEG
jgi:predicted metal-dependent peptidase